MCNKKSHSWKILLLFIGIFHCTHAAYLRCYKGTLDNFEVVPLSKAQLLVNSTCISLGRLTVAIAFGYRGKVDGPFTTAMLLAHLAIQTINVLLLDWQKEAETGILGPQLSYALSAVPNAILVGDEFGQAVTMLAQAGLNMKRLHLLGHSLGAHVMGCAGKRAKQNGHIVARITGMDPARALFENTSNGLDRLCADVVDIIHSDPGGYGMNYSLGTVDFWPNYVGKRSTQPGCPAGNFEMFSLEDLCSHDRCWKLYLESLHSPTAFPSAFAPDCYTWARDPASSTRTDYMGYLVNTSATGNYFLSTGPTSPYSLGTRGLYPIDNQTMT